MNIADSNTDANTKINTDKNTEINTDVIHIHAIVFFDSLKLKPLPLSSKIYKKTITWYERKFVKEFVEFGSKELLSMFSDINSENELCIELQNSLYICISVLDDTGCALLISSKLKYSEDHLPSVEMKRLIQLFNLNGHIPDEMEISQYFKIKIIKYELEETKKVLHRTLSKSLKRGENIEELVHKTKLLSNTSKDFFSKSKELNRCCWIFPRLSFS